MDIKERFLKYVSYHTTSDELSETSPSSARQLILAEELAKDLRAIGLSDAHMDKYGYVYGFLPGTGKMKAASPLGLIAHMDTSPDVSGKNVNPSTVKFTGDDITLKNGETISVKAFPFLQKYIGEELIVTDGSTLLGADDKAGIAEIFAACEYLTQHPEVAHCPISVCITPDEEIGCGTDNFNFNGFEAKRAYTVDGGAIGEIEYENFNAASATFIINGINIHPGSAKNKMKNAVLIAAELINMLPAAETPAHTEGYEGFYHVSDISGNESKTVIKMLIRDHSMSEFCKRKSFITKLSDYLNSVYENCIELEIKDSYYNMKEKILPYPELIENAKIAMQQAGITPVTVPIRGGTDGARLSFEGIPCPNLPTGGENFHSVHEFIPVSALYKMTEVIINLVQL